MLTIEEKKKVKDVISDGLGIRRDINFAYFLNEINETNQNVKELESKFNLIINNQRILDNKLDMIINMLRNK